LTQGRRNERAVLPTQVIAEQNGIDAWSHGSKPLFQAGQIELTQGIGEQVTSFRIKPHLHEIVVHPIEVLRHFKEVPAQEGDRELLFLFEMTRYAGLALALAGHYVFLMKFSIRTRYVVPVVVCCLAIMVLGSCATGVRRIDADQQVDLSGSWNDTDSRIVAEKMSQSILAGRWITDFQAASGQRPAVVVGNILNRTHDHISTNTMTTEIEKAFLNSGSVRVLQGGAFRDQLRAERTSQQEVASPETAARLGREIGANFVLQGVVTSIVDSSSRQRLVYYQVEMYLTSVETAEKVWIETEQIKKLVAR
jgi:penicillin-binding protein activator